MIAANQIKPGLWFRITDLRYNTIETYHLQKATCETKQSGNYFYYDVWFQNQTETLEFFSHVGEFSDLSNCESFWYQNSTVDILSDEEAIEFLLTV